MAQTRMYEVEFTYKNGKEGTTLVTADNKAEAKRKAKRIGIKESQSVKKWGNANFLRWVYEK